MHARCSKVLVKDIKRCKVTGGRSESSLVRHRVLVTPSIFADEAELCSVHQLLFPCSRAK